MFVYIRLELHPIPAPLAFTLYLSPCIPNVNVERWLRLQGVMKKEMGEREKDLRLSQHQYQELHAQLQDMLFNIAQETDEVKKLEAELREGR